MNPQSFTRALLEAHEVTIDWRGNNASVQRISSCAQKVGVGLAHHVIMIVFKQGS